MRSSRLLPSALIAGAVIVAAAIVSLAGPLNPPAGPVASSYKTLSEVEPRIAVNATNTPPDGTSQFVISQPGSYYLTGNINGVAARNAIRITAAGVTLDLDGFALTGVVGSNAGIALTNGAQRVTIRNGTISGFGLDGIDGGFNLHGRYEGLVASGNGGGASGRCGIRAGGDAMVTNCNVSSNTGNGTICNDTCTIRDCIATANTDTGFFFGAQCTLEGCTAQGNTKAGYLGTNFGVLQRCTAVGAPAASSRGFEVGTGCRIVDCTASGYATGFIMPSRGVLSGCVASANGGTGISTGDYCEVLSCAATGNGGFGISVGSNVLVSGCNANLNTSDNIAVFQRCNVLDCVANGSTAGNGINLSFQTNTASRCTASGNALNGIYAQQRSRVLDCSCRDNQQNGIRANFASSASRCYCDANTVCGIICDGGGAFEFTDNHCAENGGSASGAGIRISVGLGRIENNTLSFNYRNLDVLAGGTIIGHNTSTAPGAGGHYNIVAGNSYGPIVNVGGVGDFTGTPNANHPMANYTH